VGVNFEVCRICYLYHFESVKFFCAHPVRVRVRVRARVRVRVRVCVCVCVAYQF
jgi:hypothetical protein